MRAELKKNIFHLAWSPDSLPASEAAAPLLDCLDHILLDLEPNLLPDAFQRCVAAIWDVLLVELWAQAEVSSGVTIVFVVVVVGGRGVVIVGRDCCRTNSASFTTDCSAPCKCW